MSAAEAQDAKSLLLQYDDEYRQLAEQHYHLDHRLDELTGKHYFSSSDQLEEVTLKKRKLAVKDRMEEKAREYVHAHSRAS